MTTGTWPTLNGEKSASTSSSWQQVVALPERTWLRALLGRRGAWFVGLTRRGKPPRDEYARALRALRMLVLVVTLMVSIGWGLVGAAALIW